MGPVPSGHLDGHLASRHDPDVELALARVRLHDRTGDDLGTCELPVGWVIGPGDLLCDDRRRLCASSSSCPHDPEVAAKLKIEERELDATGVPSLGRGAPDSALAPYFCAGDQAHGRPGPAIL